jgi:hypothetical protein
MDSQNRTWHLVTKFIIFPIEIAHLGHSKMQWFINFRVQLVIRWLFMSESREHFEVFMVRPAFTTRSWTDNCWTRPSLGTLGKPLWHCRWPVVIGELWRTGIVTDSGPSYPTDQNGWVFWGLSGVFREQHRATLLCDMSVWFVKHADPSLDMGYIIRFLSCMSLHGLQEKVNVNSLEEEMQSGRPLVI